MWRGIEAPETYKGDRTVQSSQARGQSLPVPAPPRFLTHRPQANETTEDLSHQVWGQFVTQLLRIETEAKRLVRRVLQKFR